MSNTLPTPALPGSGSRDRGRHYAPASQPDLRPAPLLFCCAAVQIIVAEVNGLVKSPHGGIYVPPGLFPCASILVSEIFSSV